MPPGTAEQAEQEVLARFDRKGNDAGDEIRITAGNSNGYHYADLRFFYEHPKRGPGPAGDGWWPSKAGIRLREMDLDAAIKALEDVRVAVHADGRSTSPEPRRRVDRPSTPTSTRRSSPAPASAGGSSRPPARPAAPASGDDEEDIPF